MRIVQTVTARPAYYDRAAAIEAVEATALSVTPHTLTQRAGYTVQAGKKAMVENIAITWIRAGAATVPGFVRLLVTYMPAGMMELRLFDKTFVTNALNESITETLQGLGILFAGDQLRFYTSDSSTGGACDYKFTAKIVTFAA